MKKKYLVLIMTMVSISTIFLTSSAYAQFAPAVHGWTDKTHYNPGEKGILYIVFRNDLSEDLILKNITIVYPWVAYIDDKWEGNVTLKNLDDVVPKEGGVYTHELEFSIPRDGRVNAATSISIMLTVDKYPYQYTGSVPISIKGAPEYRSFEDMEKIVTLFTVTVVLIIVCTIILAATIFLSARRPTVKWREAQQQ